MSEDPPHDELLEVHNEPSKRFGIGLAETIGRRPTMEDVSTFQGCYRGSEDEDLFAVFDGHGTRAAASYCAAHFGTFFGEYLDQEDVRADCDPGQLSAGFDASDALTKAFQKADKKMRPWASNTGCTAAVAYVRKDSLWVANAGDARVVLVCKEDEASGGNVTAQRLTVDHKASDESEAARIRAMPDGVVVNGRVLGVLAVSRALGDASLFPYVTADPHVQTVRPLPATATHLILACDGLWDVVPDSMAAKVVANVANPKQAAKALKDRAYVSGSTDNISVMVIGLHGQGLGEDIVVAGKGNQGGFDDSDTSEASCSVDFEDDSEPDEAGEGGKGEAEDDSDTSEASCSVEFEDDDEEGDEDDDEDGEDEDDATDGNAGAGASASGSGAGNGTSGASQKEGGSGAGTDGAGQKAGGSAGKGPSDGSSSPASDADERRLQEEEAELERQMQQRRKERLEREKKRNSRRVEADDLAMKLSSLELDEFIMSAEIDADAGLASADSGPAAAAAASRDEVAVEPKAIHLVRTSSAAASAMPSVVKPLSTDSG